MFDYGILSRGPGVDPRGLEFAVVDVETTGLDPGRGSRICEVGVVRMWGDGHVTDEYATLVNPQISRISNSEFHGITTAEAREAPTFSEIAGDVLGMLSNAIVVGHNLEFEERFLAAEFAQAGMPVSNVAGLCTLVMARAQLELWSYRLPEIALTLTGQWPGGQHSALADARACGWALSSLIGGSPQPLTYRGPRPRVLPQGPRGSRVAARAVGMRRGTEGWLTSLAAQLPLIREAPSPVTGEVARYTALLGHVLDDGKVTREEAEQLAVLARRAGLTQATAHGVHQQFLLDVRQRAEADGEVTNAEMRELQRAAKNLGSRHLIEDLEEAAAAERQRRNGPLKGWRLLPVGDDPDVVSVMEMATSYGATAGVNVTKTTQLVIAPEGCDDSRVGKATEMGIQVLAPAAARARLDQAIAQTADSSRGLLGSAEGERVAAELTRDREEGPPEWHAYWRREELDPAQCRRPFYRDGDDDLEIVVDIPSRKDRKVPSGNASRSGCASAIVFVTAIVMGTSGMVWTLVELLRHAVA